jgi:hypothetical protein
MPRVSVAEESLELLLPVILAGKCNRSSQIPSQSVHRAATQRQVPYGNKPSKHEHPLSLQTVRYVVEVATSYAATRLQEQQ